MSRKEEKEVIYYHKEFINKEPSTFTGFIFAYVSLDSWGKEENRKYRNYSDIHTDFEIGDCSDRIRLEFPVEKDEDYKKSMYKIKVLEGTIKDFKRAIKEARKKYRQLPEKPKEKDNEEDEDE